MFNNNPWVQCSSSSSIVWGEQLPLIVSGMVAGDDMVDKMMQDAPGPINFTTFLTHMADKLINWIDTEDILIAAFQIFDRDNRGWMTEDM